MIAMEIDGKLEASETRNEAPFDGWFFELPDPDTPAGCER
jgi:hypothetical protein